MIWRKWIYQKAHGEAQPSLQFPQKLQKDRGRAADGQNPSPFVVSSFLLLHNTAKSLLYKKSTAKHIHQEKTKHIFMIDTHHSITLLFLSIKLRLSSKYMHLLDDCHDSILYTFLVRIKERVGGKNWTRL